MNTNKISKILAMLVIFSFLAAGAYAVSGTGNVNTLCQDVIEDANTAGGCFDSDDVELGVTTLFTIIPVEVSGLAGMIVLVAVLGFVAAFLGLKARNRQF